MARNVYRKVFGEEFSIGSPLRFADELWHRVIINREPPMRVGRSLGLGKAATVGVLRILRHCNRVPSKERLALIAMRVPDVTDEDIAEWFSEPVFWARAVRKTADALRRDEPIPDAYEFVDDGYQPGDPTPEQIAVMMAEIRRKEDRWANVEPARVEIRSYQWSGKAYASISQFPHLRPQGGARVGRPPKGSRPERRPRQETTDRKPQQKHRPLWNS